MTIYIHVDASIQNCLNVFIELESSGFSRLMRETHTKNVHSLALKILLHPFPRNQGLRTGQQNLFSLHFILCTLFTECNKWRFISLSQLFLDATLFLLPMNEKALFLSFSVILKE